MGLLSENAATKKTSIFNGTFKWKYVKKKQAFPMGVLCEICDRRANQRRIEPAFIGERQTI